MSYTPPSSATSSSEDISFLASKKTKSLTVNNFSRLQAKFAPLRQLVPLTSQPDRVTYLNSSFATPGNLIVNEALTSFSHKLLHDPDPKPSFQADTEETRALVARYINAASPSSIAFTRDTTEALGNFIRSVPFQPGDNVVILDTEHPNHAYGWLSLRDQGLEVRQVDTLSSIQATGKVEAANADTFSDLVDSRTRAIGISSIMFHSGQRNDISGICARYRPRGIHVLVDMTQQVGFCAVDVQKLGRVSAAGFSFHKGLNCPTGLGVLYVDPELFASPSRSEGGRFGTDNPGLSTSGNDGPESLRTPPIVGYGAVLNSRADLLAPPDEITYHPSAKRFEHLNLGFINVAAAKAYLTFYLDTLNPKDLEDYLYGLGDELREGCHKVGVRVVGPTERESHAPHLYILDLHAEAWKPYLRKKGVYVTHYRLGVRVSLGFYNNIADIERLCGVLREGVADGIPLR